MFLARSIFAAVDQNLVTMYLHHTTRQNIRALQDMSQLVVTNGRNVRKQLTLQEFQSP